jgi:type I restriction enzyme S subunit
VEVKPGYKQTEVGVIPEEWGVEKLKECCSRLTVGFVGTCEPFYTRATDGVLLLRTGNLQGDRIALSDVKYVSKSFHAANKKSKVSRGDILIARHGNFGSAVLVPASIDDVNALNIVIIRTDEKLLLGRFAAYCINSDAVRGQALGKAAGSTQVVINTGEIAELMLPLPPLTEQCTIAGALSDVDELIGALNQLIAKKRDLKLAVTQQLLTGQKRLPGFSGEWEMKRFGELAVPRTERVDPRRSGGYEFCVELEHIESGTGKLLGNASTNENSSLKSVFHQGDVLFGKLRAYLRKYWLASKAGLCSTEIWVFAPNSRLVTSAYLYQMVKVDRFIDAASATYGTHMPRSDWNVVKNYELPLPTKPEQTAIAEALSDMDAELAALEQRRDKTRALKQGMMQELLTGKTRLV